MKAAALTGSGFFGGRFGGLQPRAPTDLCIAGRFEVANTFGDMLE